MKRRVPFAGSLPHRQFFEPGARMWDTAGATDGDCAFEDGQQSCTPTRIR